MNLEEGFILSIPENPKRKERIMNRFFYLRLGVVILFLFGIVCPSFAAPPFLPDIPKSFTEVFPADEYPDFEYMGLTPSCAACPGCDDEYSFFVKGGLTNKLVVYFEGGGACWDTKNCLYAPTYSQEATSITRFADTSDRGIFDTADPHNPFKNWYFVYIPYCTGDVHWGANDQEYEDCLGLLPVDTWTIRHRGFVNFQVVLQWIKDNFEGPNKIFVTGSSAGSYGAIMGFPFIKEAFPGSDVSVLGDAGNGVIDEYFQNNSIFNWNIQVPTWIPGFEGGFTPTMTMPDVYKNIAAYYPQSKVAQYTAAWDWNQTFFYNVMVTIGNYSTAGFPDDCVPHYLEWNEYEPVWCDWHETMLGYVYDVAASAPNYRYYLGAGDDHTIMGYSKFYEEDSAGVSFLKWLKAMINGPVSIPGKGGKWKNVECEDCGDPLPCD